MELLHDIPPLKNPNMAETLTTIKQGNGQNESILANMGYSNYYPHPPLFMNLGISRGGGALTLEFPGKRVH